LQNEKTMIRYVLLREQDSGVLYILDLGGDVVHKNLLVKTDLSTGSHEIGWDGRNLAGDRVSSGVYMGFLKIGETNKKLKIVVRN
jgi:flagellar hook assembly protein FlgD